MKTLYLTSYSKARSIATITSKLSKYPKQVCNTPEAFKGLVMEFVPVFRAPGPVGSLNEYWQHDKETTFNIMADDGQVRVVRTDDGDFVVADVSEYA